MTENAQRFRQMAERIEATAEAEFGGAVLVVGPDGEAIEYLLTDPKQDIAFFWLSVKSRVETIYAELQDKQRRQTTGRW